ILPRRPATRTASTATTSAYRSRAWTPTCASCWPSPSTWPAPSKLPMPLFLLVFLSGVSGLVYEVLWAKYLGLALGGSAPAHAVVLSVYMAGLSAGNYFFGARADRTRDPLRLYAWLELGICALGVASVPL